MAFPALAPWLTGLISQKLARSMTSAHMGAPWSTFAGGISPTTAGGAHGVVGGTDLLVTISAGLTLSVAPGHCFITGTSSITQGAYYTYNDVASLVALTAHSAQPRIDLVYVRARDAAEDSGGVTGIALDKVTGTPAGIPVAPAVPSGSLVLAEVAVPATSGAVVITDRRPYATALGGVIRCKSTTRPTGAARWPGQSIFETDTGQRHHWDGVGANWTCDTPRVLWNGAVLDGTAGRRFVVQGGNPAITTDGGSFVTVGYNVAFLSIPSLSVCGGAWNVPIQLNILDQQVNYWSAHVADADGTSIPGQNIRVQYQAIGFTN